MRKFPGLTVLLFLFSCTSYKKIHEQATFVDTHNDILTACLEHNYRFDQDLRGKTHSDLNRFAEGGVDVQVFSVWCDGNQQQPFAWANRQIDTLLATAARNPHRMMLVKNSTDLATAVAQHKLGCMMGVEGGHMIESSLEKLNALYHRGVRYLTLTWNNSNPWATSAMDETRRGDSLPHKGLTEFGKEVVRRMNQLGMLVDVSHVGEQTFWDVIATTTKPVIASHSNAYTLCPVFRNLKDDQIRAIGTNGGVIHLNFYSGFVDSSFERRNRQFHNRHRMERDSLLRINPEPYWAEEFLFAKYPEEVKHLRPPLSALLDHLDYIVHLIGVDHVGLGSDFDGISSSPQQLDDVTTYPLITQALLKRGYSKKDMRKILGENFIRVLKANESLK